MIYVIVGPTASGKTKLAEEIYHKLDDPILINGDAYQIYKDMDIGTAKISKDDPLYSKYKLLDVISCEEEFSVSEYQSLIRKEIDEGIKNHKDIIIVGGTGLYIRAALYDYRFEKELETDNSDLLHFSNDELHKILKKLDPIEADKIHPNNRKRVLRSIQLIRSIGESKTDFLNKQEHKIIYENVKIFYINPNRELLYKRINDRVEKMIDEGLINEVENLIKKYNLSSTAVKAIGYQEIISYLNGEITLENAKEIIKKKTRNYAKRQNTFFKHQFKNVIICNDIDEFLKLI